MLYIAFGDTAVITVSKTSAESFNMFGFKMISAAFICAPYSLTSRAASTWQTNRCYVLRGACGCSALLRRADKQWDVSGRLH